MNPQGPIAVALIALLCACTGIIGTRDSPEGDVSGEDPAAEVAADLTPPSAARRLTVSEYDNTVRDLLGDDTNPARRFLPGDARTPFDNDYTTQQPSAALVDGAEALALDVTSRLLGDPERLAEVVGCTPSGPDDQECMETFVRGFGRRALRRPLAEAEVDRYLSLQQYAIEAGSFEVGVETILWAFLQDPGFLYRIEVGEPVDGEDGLFRLNNWEVVTRLSYFLKGSTPDDGLLDRAAEADAEERLLSGEDVRALAADLLSDPQTRNRFVHFQAMWLGYEDMLANQDMWTETAQLIRRVIFDERLPWRTIFTFGETFVTAELAEHYGLPAPDDPAGSWVDYGDSGRAGILSHGTYLSVGARFADSSPVQRGIAVRTRILCQELAPPPPNVNADEPPMANDSECKWETFAAMREPDCIGCHGQVNPIGWALESYDREGRYRDTDIAGCDLSTHTQVEVEDLGQFQGPAELGQLLAEDQRAIDCMSQQLYQFALGRPLEDGDADFIAALRAEKSEDQRLDELLLDYVSVEAFLHRRESN